MCVICFITGSLSYLQNTHLARKKEQKAGQSIFQLAEAKKADNDAKRMRVTDHNEVFVLNLPFEATEESIEHFFVGCGSILNVCTQAEPCTDASTTGEDTEMDSWQASGQMQRSSLRQIRRAFGRFHRQGYGKHAYAS